MKGVFIVALLCLIDDGRIALHPGTVEPLPPFFPLLPISPLLALFPAESWVSKAREKVDGGAFFCRNAVQELNAILVRPLHQGSI